ncbi:MAG: carbon storage regulator [Planctomycetota bacterium]
MRYNIKITIKKTSNREIKISIEAPKDMVTCREEVVKKVNEKNVLPSTPDVINHTNV